MNIAKILEFIDSNYLSKFNKENVNSKIELQKPFGNMVEYDTEYSIAKGASTENKSIMMMNYVVDTIKDRKSFFTLKALQSILYDPLNEVLKDKESLDSYFQEPEEPKEDQDSGDVLWDYSWVKYYIQA